MPTPPLNCLWHTAERRKWGGGKGRNASLIKRSLLLLRVPRRGAFKDFDPGGVFLCREDDSFEREAVATKAKEEEGRGNGRPRAITHGASPLKANCTASKLKCIRLFGHY